MSARAVAVVGAGWAGLAAAVRAVEAGHRVSVFEMAPQPGGRARSFEHQGLTLDNGQHILIGAYTHTLALMRTVGADPEALLDRRPLALPDAQGRGLRLPAGPALPAFVRGVLALRDWPLGQRLALLRAAWRWRRGGFRAASGQTVADLARALPQRVRTGLIEPLCVAALNTPAGEACAQVFLRVLHDALFSGPGAADLLLPRAPLARLLPQPAVRWLLERGAAWHALTRVQAIGAAPDGRWHVDGQAFDAVLLACPAGEAARLTRPWAPAWSSAAAALRHEPIVSVVLQSRGTRLAAPMVSLPAQAPAQFAFDLGALDRRREGLFAFVASGARAWVEAGLDATAQAVLAQASAAFAPGTWREPPTVLHTMAERRATFVCTPGLVRPPAHILPGLAAAGDYVAGPYPSTLEGAVRSAHRALDALALRTP